jgi:hypothetical protein
MSQPIHDSSPAIWTIILGPGLSAPVRPDERDDDELDFALAGALEHAYALGSPLRTVVVIPAAARRHQAAFERQQSGGPRSPRMPMGALRRPAKLLASDQASSALNLLRALSYIHTCSRSAVVLVIDLDVRRGELPSPVLSSAVIDQATTWQRLVVVGSPPAGDDSPRGGGWTVPGEQPRFICPVMQIHPVRYRPRLPDQLGGGPDSLAYAGLVGGTLFAWARVFTRLRRQVEDAAAGTAPPVGGTPDLFRDVLIPGFENLLVARLLRRESVWPSLPREANDLSLNGSPNGLATVCVVGPVWPTMAG